jgi:hypothetical protein
MAPAAEFGRGLTRMRRHVSAPTCDGGGMDSVTEVITTMFDAVDDLDWDTVRRCCTSVLVMDYTSLWGGEPGQVPIDDLVADWARWQPGLTRPSTCSVHSP